MEYISEQFGFENVANSLFIAQQLERYVFKKVLDKKTGPKATDYPVVSYLNYKTSTK